MRRKKKGTVSKRARNDTSLKKKALTRRKVKKSAVRKSRVPKVRNAGTFTEAQFWQFIRSALRQKSRWWKPRLKCLEAARRPNQSNNRRLKWEFQCSHCSNWFPQTQVEVNHIVAAGTLSCAADLPLFVENLFCEADGLEVVCKGCHTIHHKKK